MRRFVSFGPAFVVLLTAGAVLIAIPGMMMRISAARTHERVELARAQLDNEDLLEQLNNATRRVADAVEPSVVHLDVGGTRGWRWASGSGWVFDDKGHIVTNAHVVGPASRITVQFFDGRVELADVVGTDPMTDVAVIKVDAGDYLVPSRRATGERVRRGDRVFAFGSPFNFKFSMSEGIVSGLGRTARAAEGQATITNYIQTDAAVNPGNSGGPLVDVNGRVIGMNVAIATAENSDGGTEGQSAGISFAIPLATIESRVEQIIAGNSPRSGYLGIRMGQPTRYTMGQREGTGVRIEGVPSAGPADQAGLRARDIITALDDEEIESAEVLRAIISSRRPGTTVNLRVIRGEEEITLRATIARMPDQILASQYWSMLGRQAQILLPDPGEDEDAKPRVQELGEQNAAARENDPAPAKTALRVNDLITHVAGTKVETTTQTLLALADAGFFSGRRVTLTIERDSDEGTQTLEIPLRTTTR
jgi:S1-C subfamily serine protease